MSIKNNVTISDIARTAKVSISTVSRVLGGTTKVSEPKRKAVLDAVSALNYQPNVFAQSLASGQSMVIGVLTQNFGSPFYDAILRGVVLGLYNTGYFPIFADGQWQPKIEKEAIMAMMRRRIDGLIVIGGYMTAEDLNYFAEQIPLIVAARNIKDFEENCIYIDNFHASYLATQHLIERGHRRIAYVSGPPDQQDAVRRQKGYIEALKDADIDLVEELIVEGNFRRQAGVLAVEMLLSRGVSFSAIYTANDQMAYGVRLALHRRGIRVPEDISLVGFDDEPAAAFMIPPLTTVRQPAVELGEEATKIILARLKDQPIPPVKKLAAQLIIRESTSLQL